MNGVILPSGPCPPARDMKTEVWFPRGLHGWVMSCQDAGVHEVCRRMLAGLDLGEASSTSQKAKMVEAHGACDSEYLPWWNGRVRQRMLWLEVER